MIGFTLQAFKGMFFDRAFVEGKVDRATAVVMSRFGARVRGRARASIRKSGSRRSRPGQTPANRTGKLKGSILFAWNPLSRSVVVGPFLFPRTRQEPPAPAVLEYGGLTTIRRRGVSRTYNFHAFPFMRPALNRELPILPQLWRDTIR